MRKAVRIVLISLMGAQAVLWMVLGFVFLARASGPFYIALLMFADGVTFGVLAVLFLRSGLLIKRMSLAFLLVNLVLSLTDQAGVLDYAVFGLNMIAVAACFALILPRRKTLPH